LVTIKKAIAADHGSSVGWSDSLGDETATFTGNLQFSSGFWLFDGQTGGGPGNWKTGFGFKVQTTKAGGAGVSIGSSATNVTVRHIEVQGNGPDGNGNPDNDLIKLNNVGSYNFTLSYAYLHDAGRTIFFARGSDVVIEYVYCGKFESTSDEHSEIASLGNPTGYEASNWTFRWCVFTHGEGTGGIIMNGDRLQVYGCVFVKLAGSVWQGNGAIGTWSWGKLTNLKVFNNSFIDLGGRALGLFDSNDSGEWRNNLFYKTKWGNGVGANLLSHSHNHYIDSPETLPTESGATTGSGNPFHDYGNLDFRLKSSTAAGTLLSGDYLVDAFGLARGLDGTADRGAYEYAPAASTKPAAPTSLQISAN
jgi:hypothetical protein